MNDPSQDFSDDPRLTAYALGELDGAERAEIEALVRSNPAAAAAVEEIRRLAGSLADALKEEAIDIRPAAEIIPIEPVRRSMLRRLQPYFYVASGLAAGWATALLIFRPASNAHLADQIAERSASIRAAKKPVPAIAEPAPAPGNLEALSEQPTSIPSSLTRGTLPPTAWLTGDLSTRVQPIVPAAVIDSVQLDQDLKNFELVQPALGAGARIALDQKVAQKEAQAGADGTDVVKLSPFEVTSDHKGYYTANTLAGTRLNSKLSDLG
ncbi:MAG TPA: hypothetical protein VHV47_07470, partial [Opitutaceae bacterium]|nr:hypothetical protein [Opitutaceae bacterium]